MAVAGCAGSASVPSSGPPDGRTLSPALSPAPSRGAATPTPTPARSQPVQPSASPLPPFKAPPTGELDAAHAGALQRALDDLVAAGSPDAIAAVITPDGSWSGAAGIDGPKGRRALPTDHFGLASVSKPILAALVLKLVEQGKLDLDAPLATYLEPTDADTNGSTLGQALSMRSGLGDTSGAAFETTYANCDKVWTRAEIKSTFTSPAGSAGTYHYSNPSYKLMGYAAERASGKPLSDALRTLVFDPVGADLILLQGPGHPTPKPWALPIAGHGGEIDLASFGTGAALPCLAFATLAIGSSGIASDAPSLARWGWNLFADKVIGPDALATMTTLTDGEHGFGIDRLREFSPDIAYGHIGSMPGYAAILAILPARQTVVVVFVNDGATDIVHAGRSVLDALGG
jgi:D-alanyl-D-alanine carboxypeptidase